MAIEKNPFEHKTIVDKNTKPETLKSASSAEEKAKLEKDQARIKSAIDEARKQKKFWEEKLREAKEKEDKHRMRQLREHIEQGGRGLPEPNPRLDESLKNFNAEIQKKIDFYTGEIAELNDQDMDLYRKYQEHLK